MNTNRTIVTACCLGLLSWGSVVVLATGQPATPVKETKEAAAGPAAETKQAGNAGTTANGKKSPVVPAGKSTAAGNGGQAGPAGGPKVAVDDTAPRRPAAKRMPVNYQTYQYQPEPVAAVGTETMLSEISREIAGKVYYELKELGEEGFAGRVAVVAAVPLSDLKCETEFGRVIAEFLLTDLADRGLSVTELRLGKDIQILPQTGEFNLTRNIAELANSAPELEYVVVSTFANTRKTLILQGRLVSLKDSRIMTSWRHSLPLNREILSLFQLPGKPFTIAVKGLGR